LEDNKLIVLFDGVCNLCNGTVMFLIKRDKKNRLRFASLQSDIAKSKLKELNFEFDSEYLKSIVIIDNGKVKTKSDAVIKIVQQLGGLWSLVIILKIIPRFIRDWFYELIAKNRYKYFGKQETCMVPTEEMKAKFL